MIRFLLLLRLDSNALDPGHHTRHERHDHSSCWISLQRDERKIDAVYVRHLVAVPEPGSLAAFPISSSLCVGCPGTGLKRLQPSFLRTRAASDPPSRLFLIPCSQSFRSTPSLLVRTSTGAAKPNALAGTDVERLPALQLRHPPTPGVCLSLLAAT